MHIDFQFAPWGMFVAALMYVVGNGVWTNHLARNNYWIGWLLWIGSAVILLIAGAFIEGRLAGSGSIWELLSGVEPEKHWIIVTLYALLSVPGTASVLFRQNMAWTRLAVIATALLVFIPLGTQLHDPDNSYLALSLGITLAVCAIMWLWTSLLDCEPEHKRKTVTVEEMSS